MHIGMLFLAVLVAAGCVAACPSVTTCRQYDVSCNTASVIELDPDLATPFPPSMIYSGDAWCHVVNCNGQAAPLGGEIPCDLPGNTSFLLLASIGMTGSFSFQTLFERAPSLFCNANTEECPAWVGLVDLSANEIVGVGVPPSPLFWTDNQLNAHLDLSNNDITTLQTNAFASATINGNLDLSGSNITTVQSNAFLSAGIGGHLSLNGNNITTVQLNAFFNIALGGNLDLSGNNITTVQSNAFSGVKLLSYGNLDLSGNNVSVVQSSAFAGAVIGGSLNLSGSAITTVQQSAFAQLTNNGQLDLSGNRISSILPLAFANAYVGGDLDLTGNAINVVQSTAFFSAIINGSLDLSSNAISVVQSYAFLSTIINGDLDLSSNNITTVLQSAFDRATIYGNLDLTGNYIAAVQSLAFANAVMLQTLNLQGNRLLVLGDLSFALATVGVIDLSGNGINGITGGAYDASSLTGGAFYNSSMAALNLANNRLTALYADTFFGMRINVAANFSNNSITLLEDGWSSAFPLEITLSMTGNPSNCSVGQLSNTLQTFVCTCASDSQLDILGNGAYCSRTPCAAPENSSVANGGFNCAEQNYASGSTCDLVCDDGFGHLNASFTSITCLGGVWGKRPNLAATYPLCVQQNRLCSVIPRAAVHNGQFVCPPTATSLFPLYTNCTLKCDAGYEPLAEKIATCLPGAGNEGLWGVLPNLTYSFPACAPKRGITELQAGMIALGSGIGGLLIAGAIYLLTKVRERIRRVEYDLELKEHLLSEQSEELDALRQVFTIPADEVRLEARIDSGAFGEVWRGRWNDMPVAVKHMQAVLLAFDNSFAREFEAETTLMRRLRHANVVTFFGAGTDRDGMPFLVCELMANSLQKLVWVPDPLRDQQKVKWARDAAQGMAFLHAKGVIHRDLKSGNLLGK